MAKDDDIGKMSRKEFREYAKNLERNVKRDTEAAMKKFEREAAEEQDRRDMQELNEILKSNLGFDLKDLQNEYNQGINDDPEWKAEVEKMLDAIKKGKQDKASRIAKGGKAKRGAKRARAKKGGCPLVIVFLLAGLIAAAYGTYEGMDALASVIW